MNCFPIDRKQLTGEIVSLCLAGITHSFLLFSFFPYAGYMAITLLENDHDVTVNNVGIYAGMLGATFTLGRFLGFLPWKVARKALGEKNALVLSLGLTGLASLSVGLSTTFYGALLARLAQGVSNCISGSVKRAAINARHNRKQEMALPETKGTPEEIYDASPEALVLAVMGWGAALGPVLGGLLSDPRILGFVFGWDISSEAETSPSAWYATYPYLLSNAFSAILCWISMVAVAVASQNPPPKTNSGSTKLGEIRPLLAPPTTESNNKSTHQKTESKRLWEFFRTLWKTNQDAKYHLIAYWSFSFVVVLCDEALPLFLITSKESTGLGLSEASVGLLLSATGFLVAIGHHAALDNVFDTENGTKDGMYRVLSACAFFGNIPVVLVPLALVLNGSSTGHSQNLLLGLTWPSFLYLVVLFAFLRGSASMFFSLIGIQTCQTLRVVHKSEGARIMTMGALLVRAVAPIAAGAIVSHFMGTVHSPHTVSSPLHSSWMVWIVIGLVFGLAASSLTLSLAKKSKRSSMTEKQQNYFANRLARMTSLGSLADSLGDFYGSASKSICSRLSNCVSFTRMAREKRRSTLVIVPSDDQKEEIAQAALEKKRPTWKEHTVAPGVDFDSVSFFIIGTHKKDKQCSPHVLTPPIMDALQKHLPTNCSESNFWLKYSLLRDGASVHSLEAKSGLARNTILAIETLNGDVFGCFMTKPWVPTNNQYRRSGESFLWGQKKRRTAPSAVDEETPELKMGDDIIDIYPWTGNNDLSQLFADDKIAIGGGVVGTHGDGFGILLQEDLLSGSSSPCVTYGNPCLCGINDENQFEVANIEIWSLTPYMFVVDAERNERHIQFIKENSHVAYGDHIHHESPSSTSAWSTFM